MELFTWSDQFSIGHNLIDSQHKEMVLIFNRLHSSYNLGRDRPQSLEILLELASHTVKHFATEEELMLRYGYPHTQNHKAEHDKLIDELIEVKGKIEKKQLALSVELLQFLKNWLMKHILHADQELGIFLKAQERVAEEQV